VNVVVEKARHQRPTAEVDDPGLVPDRLFDVRANAHAQNAASADGQRFGDVVAAVDRDDAAVHEHQVGGGDQG